MYGNNIILENNLKFLYKMNKESSKELSVLLSKISELK